MLPMNIYATVAVSGLCPNGTVKYLRLRGGVISGPDNGETIERILRRSQNITELDLSNSLQVVPEVVACIAGTLRDNGSSLKMLNLSFCNIGDRGMAQLCAALRSNTILEGLRVDEYNGITEIGTMELADSLPNMKGLKRLWFEWYPGVSLRVQKSVTAGLYENQSLLRVLASGEEHLPLEHSWKMRSEYYPARNRMKSFVGHPAAVVAPVVGDEDQRENNCGDEASHEPSGLWPYLLYWSRGLPNKAVTASLMYTILRGRANDIFFVCRRERKNRATSKSKKGGRNNGRSKKGKKGQKGGSNRWSNW